MVDPQSPLRFTPNWDRVLTAAATYARDNLSLPWDKVRPSAATHCVCRDSVVRQTRGVVAASESLGGYLLAQACAHIDPGLVQGCITDPASPNMAFAVGYTVLGPLITPFASVNASLLAALCPSCVQYAAPYWTVNATYAPVQVRTTPRVSLHHSHRLLLSPSLTSRSLTSPSLTLHTVGLQSGRPDKRSVGVGLPRRPGRRRQNFLLRRHRRPRPPRAHSVRLAHPRHGPRTRSRTRSLSLTHSLTHSPWSQWAFASG